MRNNYFGKLIKYIKNVYKIDDELRSLTDGRINPTYQTSHVVSLALFGFSECGGKGIHVSDTICIEIECLLSREHPYKMKFG